MSRDELEKLRSLVIDLGWDCQSMTTSGIHYYNQICIMLDLEPYEMPNYDYCDITKGE